MTSLMRCSAVAFVLVLASGVNCAHAASTIYVEANAGRTRFDLGKAELDQWSEIPTESSTLDPGGIQYSLAVGIRFSQYLAVEVAYVDLGTRRYLVEADGAAARLDLGSKAGVLSMIAAWPVNRILSLEGRAGIVFSSVDIATLLGAAAVGTLVVLDPYAEVNSWLFDDDDPPELDSGGGDPGWVIGAGIVAALSDHWSARLAYDYFDGKAAGLRHPVRGTELDSRAGRWMFGIRYEF